VEKIDSDPGLGLENFSATTVGSGTRSNIIPENFIENYDYEDGNYYFSEQGYIDQKKHIEKTLIYIQYDSETYLEAKAHSLENLILAEESIGEYNGYQFFINKTSVKSGLTYLDGKHFPKKFLSFAYNDEANTLVFIGFYVVYPEVEADVAELVADNWGAFLEKYYGEWYSFS
jgi:hypothetical protein